MKLIIDEYTLPDQFKSTRVLHTPIHKEKPATPNYQKSDMEEIESVPEDTDSDYSTSSASTLDKVPISFTLQDYYSKQTGTTPGNGDDGRSRASKVEGRDDSWSVSTYTESVNEEEAVDANPYNIANSGPGHDLREDFVHIDADHVYKAPFRCVGLQD